mmetsp:Transcript_39180/g.59046  ORF Transcript_39180/g.59046 Transcript_39180/m.59046 type:complete len:101 (+) Transcript_39180:1036-1338(+)
MTTTLLLHQRLDLNPFLQKDDILVVLLASFIILPLSLLRDMTPLAKFSIFSVLTFVGIVMIIVVIYFMNPGDEVRLDGGTVGENWFKIKTDMFERCVLIF